MHINDGIFHMQDSDGIFTVSDNGYLNINGGGYLQIDDGVMNLRDASNHDGNVTLNGGGYINQDGGAVYVGAQSNFFINNKSFLNLTGGSFTLDDGAQTFETHGGTRNDIS